MKDSGTDRLLAKARSTYRRVSAAEASRAVIEDGAILVDTRPEWQRTEYGRVPAALNPVVVERNHLEWRFDPTGDARLPVASADAQVIVLCQQGYSSSLAAANLVELGVPRATDVVGGFEAWVEAGLPVEPPPGGETPEPL